MRKRARTDPCGGRSAIAGRLLLRPNRNRGDVVLPFQLEFASIAAGGDCILQLFDGHWRLLHFHVGAAQIHAGIVGITVLAGLFIDDELPFFGVLHQDVKRIRAGRHFESGDVEIGSGLEGSGGIRAGAPYGISRIPRHYAAISKDLATTHRGRGVLNRDSFAGYGGG